jgi:hypothetical protein
MGYLLVASALPISTKIFLVPIDLLLSPSRSGSSLDSAPMSESEEGQSPMCITSDVIFPIDGKLHFEKDRAYIMSLPEIEREAILAERADLIQCKTKDQVLRKLCEGYTAKDGRKSKAGDRTNRQADTTELEDVQRKVSRQMTTSGVRWTESRRAYEIVRSSTSIPVHLIKLLPSASYSLQGPRLLLLIF